MKRLLGVGIATVDIISDVTHYPKEDDEIRATRRRTIRGGNATNSLVVLAQLGVQCDWAGVIATDVFANIIKQDLDQHNIGTEYVTTETGATPVSCINSSGSGARSIVHYRDLAEYSFLSFKKIPVEQYDWVHFEGRNVVELAKMLPYLKALNPSCRLSLEIEKPRDGIEALIPLADVIFFSKDYVQRQGVNSAQAWLQQVSRQWPGKLMTCTWGQVGASCVTPVGVYHEHVANNITVVDSIAAGDTFNAGFIYTLLTGESEGDCLQSACLLAEKKCQQQGLVI